MIEVGKYSIVSLQEAVESAKEMLRLWIWDEKGLEGGGVLKGIGMG